MVSVQNKKMNTIIEFNIVKLVLVYQFPAQKDDFDFLDHFFCPKEYFWSKLEKVIMTIEHSISEFVWY